MKTNGSFIKISGYILSSALLHLFLLWNLAGVSRSHVQSTEKLVVKITPVEVPPPAPPPSKPLPPRPLQSPKLPKKPKHRVATERRTKKAKSNTPPVQGLSKDSFIKGGKSTFQAPVGNTLMTGDQGIRK